MSAVKAREDVLFVGSFDLADKDTRHVVGCGLETDLILVT